MFLSRDYRCFAWASLLACTWASGCAGLHLGDAPLAWEKADQTRPQPTPYPLKPRTAAVPSRTNNSPPEAAASKPSLSPPTITDGSASNKIDPPVEAEAVAVPFIKPVAVVTAPPAVVAPVKSPVVEQAMLVEQPRSGPPSLVALVSHEQPAEKPMEEKLTSEKHQPVSVLDSASKEATPAELSPEERLAQWQKERDTLIEDLQQEVRRRRWSSSRDPQLARLEQQLRLLYVAAERHDDAVEKIDDFPAAEQEAYKHLLFGMATWQSAEEATRPALRNAKIQRSLRDAQRELAKVSKLDLKNLAFCEKVESYGWFTEFPRSEFKPNQQVILYVEVENFAAEAKTRHEFETELQGSYQIFDAAGSMVAERKLPLDREICRNFRRDYFLAYRIYLPEKAAAGKYRLELTIEDLKAHDSLKGRKFGNALIDFSLGQ